MSRLGRSLPGQTLRIGVVDLRLPSNFGDDAVRAWRAARSRVWLTRCHATLTIDAGESVTDLVSRLQGVIARSGRAHARIGLDLVSHGGRARAPDGRIAYVMQLGNGLYFSNAHVFRPLAGTIGKVRLFACGEASPVLPGISPEIGREALAWALADALGCTVASSAATAVFSINPRPDPDPSVAVDGFQGGGAVVYHYGPGRSRVAQPLWQQQRALIEAMAGNY